jgi:hypothetical protein
MKRQEIDLQPSWEEFCAAIDDLWPGLGSPNKNEVKWQNLFIVYERGLQDGLTKVSALLKE